MASKPEIQFLHRKYQRLNTEPEVEQAARRTFRRTREALPQAKHEARIANYLNRFAEFKGKLAQAKDDRSRERAIERAKQIILDPYITTYEDIPESYWKSYEATLRSRGQAADWASLPEKEREKMRRADTAPLLEDQRASLEEWFDYFLSPDSDDMPDAIKYWIFRSLTQLQAYEKTEGTQQIEFPRRSKGSLKKFPDLHHEALREVVDAIEKKLAGQKKEFEYDIEPEDQQRFDRFLQTEKFADLYAWANELINPIPEHLLPITDGEWRKYPKGSDSELLASTLRGKGTGLCIAGKGAAKRYINNGDLYVYFSLDEHQQPVFPRAAIHVAVNESSKQHVAEVRGIAYKQNLDPYIAPVVSAKLAEFPDGYLYQKKTADMQQVTTIEQKTKQGQPLTKGDLTFLYEVDTKIQGFGYQPDPRIPELRKGRDVHADMLTIFECTEDQIAHSPTEVNERTQAYVGPLYHTDPTGRTTPIFQLIGHLDHIYTQFPEGKIRRPTIEIGGKSKTQLKAELKANNIYFDFAQQLIDKPEFTTAPDAQPIDLIRLTVADLGFTTACTTTALFKRATELGLELCPAEVGPQYRLHYLDQPDNEYLSIGMQPILGSSRGPRVFRVYRDLGRLRLSTDFADPDYEWHPEYEFVFALRKVKPSNT